MSPKSILVATIGTRDLAFCVSSDEWLNLGNSFVADSNSISEQALVQMELGLENSDFRFLTEYLNENWQQYQHQIKPIVLGKLIHDRHQELKQIYLVATDQNESVKFRDKDTIFVAKIVQKWITSHYPIETHVILQGPEGDSPANFEQMFRWWKLTWQNIAENVSKETSVLLCVKGGVGAFSEAGRITALSRFGEDTQFYDFIKDDESNRRGNPSRYTLPFKGTNYLWDRQQQEALALLKRYDYEAVERSLKSYYRSAAQNSSSEQLMGRVRCLLKAANYWNQANFQSFADALEKADAQWWWAGYEAAYLGRIRFLQGNTTEALFHSFRAVEGMMYEWALFSFPRDIICRDRPDDLARGATSLLKRSITRHPKFQNYADQFVGKEVLPLYGYHLDNLMQTAKPHYRSCQDIQIFWDNTKGFRNQVFHRLLGLDQSAVFQAWKTNSFKEWENRILGCLNFISEQDFASLSIASLMETVHQELKEAIGSYQPH